MNIGPINETSCHISYFNKHFLYGLTLQQNQRTVVEY